MREIGSNHESIKDQVSEIMDAADTILLCVSHQNTLVDDILSFSKLDSMMLSLVPRGTSPSTILRYILTTSSGATEMGIRSSFKSIPIRIQSKEYKVSLCNGCFIR